MYHWEGRLFTAVSVRSYFTVKIFFFALVNKLSPSCLGIFGDQANTFLLGFVFNKVVFFSIPFGLQ